MSFIEIINLNKTYQNQNVLENLNLKIKKGEFTTLLGASGCGKSTLLRCLVGFEKINSGTIMLDGLNITDLKPEKRGIGLIFQNYSLFPTMNIYDNVAFGLLNKNLNKEQTEEVVIDALKNVNLENSIKKYPYQLSGGEQQRVALARTLVTNPKVLLLDEPFSAIDAKLRKSLQYRLKDIHDRTGITSIFVTHDQNEAMILSDMIHVMNDGEIVQSGSPIEIYTKPNSQFVASFIGNYNIFTKEEALSLNLDLKMDKKVAIRPETVVLSKHNESEEKALTGKVSKVFYQASVIRYQVDVQGLTVISEAIFNDGNEFDINEIVSIKFDEENFVELR